MESFAGRMSSAKLHISRLLELNFSVGLAPVGKAKILDRNLHNRVRTGASEPVGMCVLGLRLAAMRDSRKKTVKMSIRGKNLSDVGLWRAEKPSTTKQSTAQRERK